MKAEIVAVPQLGKEIIWEKNIIRIPFDTENERDKKIYDLIKNLQTKVEKLEEEKLQFNFLSLTDSQAKEKIIDYLKEKKREGHGVIEIFELSNRLRIPAPQVENIIEGLEKEGAVKSIA